MVQYYGGIHTSGVSSQNVATFAQNTIMVSYDVLGTHARIVVILNLTLDLD